MNVLERITRVKFDSPTPFGMDATWDGKPLHCKWMDLSGRIGNRDSFTYPLLECDVSQSNYWEPMNIMVSEVNYENLMEYFKTLEDLWTQAIHTVYIFVDNRPLADDQLCPDFWKNFCPWMKARASTIGPLRERTTAIHVPICETTGLDRVHFTWAGTFVLECLVFLFPDKHFVLIDTDCVPTSLFEIEKLARLMWQRDTDFDMVNDEAKILSAVDPPCPSMVMLCTESKAEINAGLVIVTSSRRQRPFTVNDAAADMVMGLLDCRRKYVTSEEHDLEYDSVAASGLLWTPLASCKASQPLHWTHAWALLGEWSGHIAFPLPTLTDDGSHDWPRHGTACLLQPEFRRRLPPFVGWAYPAFEQGALAPLVFLPATFPIIVLPGDKMFQSRDVSPEFQMAPITHAYGGSKTRVGRALRAQGNTAVMPLLVTLCGGDSKLPLWAHPDGCDFIRGSRLINQTLNAPNVALSSMEVACLQTLWREVEPLSVGPPIWQAGCYDIPVLSLPDAISALGPSAISIFQQVKDMYPWGTTEETLQLHTFKALWAKWDDDERRKFHGRWCYTVATSPLLLTEHLKSPFRVEFSGLGGSHVLEEPFVADLFVKCMPSAPCYGPSLAYVDRKETNSMWATSIGRTAQTHEYHKEK